MTLPSPNLTVVLDALRAYLKAAFKGADLADQKVAVGGWSEIPNRDTALNVYAHEGKLHRKAGFLFNEEASLKLILTFHSGTALGDREVLALRDALMRLVYRFGHELLAGLEISGWEFDHGETTGKGPGKNLFMNVLQLSGKITTVTAGQSGEEDVIATITHVVFGVSQEEI